MFHVGEEMRTKQSMTICFGLAFIFLFVAVGSAVAAEAPAENFSKIFISVGYDEAWSVQQTDDGGYILAGSTTRNMNSSIGGGSWDALLIKTDSKGTEQWNRTFGDFNVDKAYSVQQISDGYILAGTTESFGAGSADGWLIKTDKNGTEQWNTTFGGAGYDEIFSAQQTSDGGYILAGTTESFGVGRSDAWLIKTYSNGTEDWNMTFGGAGYDYLFSVQQTSDDGYILTGYTGEGASDAWLIKTDKNGIEQWNTTFGGTDGDYTLSVQQTSDKGYILAGATDSFGAGSADAWLIKTDKNGTEQWNTTFGGTDYDELWSVLQTSDGYIMAGHTYSSGKGGADGWLIKTNLTGIEQWNKTFGDAGEDYIFSAQNTSDGGYVMAGFTESSGAGESDAWLIKTDSEGTLVITAKCPVDIEIVDADGLKINKAINQIPGATYTEIDINGDGEPDDIVSIPDPKPGDYQIEVIPEEDADPADTYTLETSKKGISVVICEDTLVSEIPDQPYTVKVTTDGEPTLPPMADAGGPYDPVEKGSPVTFDASGSYDSDGVIVSYEWDLGNGDAAYEPNPTYIYDETGVYTLMLTVTDDDGNSVAVEYQYVVVYDPEGGFVTGAGWIYSPEGAYTADPSLNGKANFGFVSKYVKDKDYPVGNTEFQFHAGDLNFHSDSYDWLVIAGAKAKYKGTGTINGEGNYGFMLSAIDAELTPSTDVDLFRIKIWDKDNNDEIVYDNMLGAEDTADPTTELQGGAIKIHQDK